MPSGFRFLSRPRRFCRIAVHRKSSSAPRQESAPGPTREPAAHPQKETPPEGCLPSRWGVRHHGAGLTRARLFLAQFYFEIVYEAILPSGS